MAIRIFLLFLLLVPNFILAQTATSVSLGTSSSSSLSVNYYTWTAVDPNLTVTANGNITGFRVQISQAYATGDMLDYTGALPSGVTASFNSTTGILIFNGTTSASNWQTLLRTVRFRSTSTTCYAQSRRVTFVAGTVFYNPLTEHFYEYVSGSISWSNSKSAAELRSYFGRVGYLATMSSEAENNFIWKLMSSDGWFGASDDYLQINTAKGFTAFASQSASEGKWHWISGPEKGTNFSNGNSPSVVTVSGQYQKWAGGEPNNAGGEHYGQFYSSNNGQWNDLPNTTLPGYICEYGDMPNDQPSVSISTRSIEIGGASSGYISGGDINVCSGSNSTVLTLNGLSGTVVRWESSFDNFFTAGTTIASTSASITVTNITKTTYYRAIVNSTAPTACSGLATSSVFLAVKPTRGGSIFAVNNSICAGGTAELTLSGQQGNVNRWQRSTDNVTWTNIANNTVSLSEILNSAGTYYYRAEVQTPNCGSAVYSETKTITVITGTPPVGGSVSSAVHATTTNSGTLSLSGHTGSVVKWQTSTNEGVTWNDIANTTTSNSYSNQADGTLYRAQVTSGSCGFAFSQPGMIVVAPFEQTVYVYNSANVGISGISVKFFSKLKTENSYTLQSTYLTDASGKCTISTSSRPSKNDYRIVVDSLNISAPSVLDAKSLTSRILVNIFNSRDFYRIDVNSNGQLTVSDIFLIYLRASGGISAWVNPTLPVSWSGAPDYRLFTSSEWSIISNSTTNLTSTYPGKQSLTIDNLVSKATTNIYLIRTGYAQ